MRSEALRHRKLIGVVLLLVLACALPFALANYRVFQMTLVLAYAIALLGLNMLTGYNGQISLGHGAFYAIGAYTAAILMDKLGVPYWATIPVAGAVCFVAGFLFGLPALRLEGLYLALATFALGVAMPQILKHEALAKWTGGSMGVVIVKPCAGWTDSQDQWLYFFRSSWVVVFFVLGWNLLRGQIGRAMVRSGSTIAAQAMGQYFAGEVVTFGVSALTPASPARSARSPSSSWPPTRSHLPLDQLAGGRRHRRARVDLGNVLRRRVHPFIPSPTRSRRRRPGALRRRPDRLHVRDAERRRWHVANGAGALGAPATRRPR
jgi:hypothetical protein